MTRLAAKSGSILCPISAIERWSRVAPVSSFLFPSLSDASVPISPDRVRQELRRLCDAVGISRHLPPILFGAEQPPLL